LKLFLAKKFSFTKKKERERDLIYFENKDNKQFGLNDDKNVYFCKWTDVGHKIIF